MKAGKLVLIIVLAVAVVGGGFGAYSKVKASSTAAETPQGQQVEVKRGNISISVTASGNLANPTQANLIFNSSGIIKERLVDMGDSVKKGQVLAHLDTIDLENAVKSAESSVKSAEKALKDYHDQYDLSSVSQAEATLAAAQAQVNSAQKAYQDVQPPYNLSPYAPSDIAQAEATLAAAQAQVNSAQKAYQDVQPPYNLSPYAPSDIAQAEATVANAHAQVKNAENDLLKAQPAYTREDVAHYQAAVDDTQKALDIAQRNLATAQLNRDRSVADAQETLRQQQNSYQLVIKLNLVGDTMYLDPTIILGTDTISDRLQTAYQALLKARDNATSAQQTGDNNVASAQSAVNKAQDALKKAQEDLDRKISDVSVGLTVQQYTLENAKASLVKAQEDLKKAKAGPDPLDVANRKHSLENAKASLVKAQEDLKKAKAGPDPVDMAALNAQLVSAKAALDKANDNLAKATIVAPFDGVVASVSGDKGDSVGASTVVIVLVNPRQLRMTAVLDETSVAQVKVGQDAQITLDPLPNTTIQGKVTSIAPVATVSSGVVNYQIFVSLDSVSGIAARSSSRIGGSTTGAAGQGRSGASTTGGNAQSATLSQLKSGMTSVAEIVTASYDNLLLIPRQAVTTSGTNRVVKVVVNGQVVEKPVQLGRSNDQYYEVVQGLSEGDKVLIPTTAPRSINPVSSRPGSSIGGGLPIGR